MKILITGAGGLLGTKLCEIAINRKHEVYSIFRIHAPPYGKPLQIDITNRAAVEKAFTRIKPDAVVHTAAHTDVDECEIKKELAWKINVNGTENIVNSCKSHDSFLVYISTDYVFDGKNGMYKETDIPSPINYYGLTKLEGEKRVETMIDNFCIARTSVIYGVAPAAGKVNFALWLIEKLKSGDNVRIVIDQWNSPTLNTNLANMIIEIVERGISGVYHLAGTTRTSRYNFARLIAKHFKLNEQLIIPTTSDQIKWLARRPKDSSLNVQKAQQILKNKPLEIKESIRIMKNEKVIQSTQ